MLGISEWRTKSSDFRKGQVESIEYKRTPGLRTTKYSFTTLRISFDFQDVARGRMMSLYMDLCKQE
jgi:hypothetical protein